MEDALAQSAEREELPDRGTLRADAAAGRPCSHLELSRQVVCQHGRHREELIAEAPAGGHHAKGSVLFRLAEELLLAAPAVVELDDCGCGIGAIGHDDPAQCNQRVTLPRSTPIPANRLVLPGRRPYG